MNVDINSKIGWIGTGVMGSSMCGNIMTAGYKVSVYNRTKNKALELIERGAVWKNSPREVAINSDVIFTILGYPSDVREVYFSDEGILSGLNKISFLVDMQRT